MRNATMVITTKDAELGQQLLATSFGPDLVVEKVIAGTASQGFAHSLQEDVRLLVVDDTLGVETARRLVRRARMARANLAVVYVSSRPDPNEEVELRRLGVLYLMVRPISYPLLTRILHKALDNDTRKYAKPVAPMRKAAVLQTATR